MNGYRVAADALMLLHAMVPLFIIGGVIAVALGGWLGWPWVRNRIFRSVHAAMMAVVLMQALLGRLCPLTIWEHELRLRAGAAEGEPTSFMAFWVERLLYYEAPLWVFTAAYTVMMALIVALWVAIPPRRRKKISISDRLL